MPLPFLAEGFSLGLESVPYARAAIRTALILTSIILFKSFFGGARYKSERLMHGKVVMVTGGTSGVGAAVVRELASRGAQIILLTRHAPTDTFLVEFIEDMRTSTKNELIYAEECDLASLHSIRLFATKWVDNAPPRRLDMIILCAAVQTPHWGTAKRTKDTLEEEWGVNYEANFHLLGLLSPAIRAQPPDRDVRIIFTTCDSYKHGKMEFEGTDQKTTSGKMSLARSKLALMVFASFFQKHLDSYERPDKTPCNARTLIVDPGLCRTPGTRRWLSGGTIIGLIFYILTWPVWWLILKSPQQGAQTFLMAAMDSEFGHGHGGRFLKECREFEPLRAEVRAENVGKWLWEGTDNQVEYYEKQSAMKRTQQKEKKEARKATKNQ